MKVKLTIVNPASESDSAFGPGIASLCLGIRELRSLNAAARRIGISYSKAWRIIGETEACLGCTLLNGSAGHGSELTEEGNRLLDAYLAVDKQLAQMALDLYAQEYAEKE